MLLGRPEVLAQLKRVARVPQKEDSEKRALERPRIGGALGRSPFAQGSGARLRERFEQHKRHDWSAPNGRIGHEAFVKGAAFEESLPDCLAGSGGNVRVEPVATAVGAREEVADDDCLGSGDFSHDSDRPGHRSRAGGIRLPEGSPSASSSHEVGEGVVVGCARVPGGTGWSPRAARGLRLRGRCFARRTGNR